MNNFCQNCGSRLDKGSSFCPNCGQGSNQSNQNTSGPRPTITKREIVTCVILSFLTCGIYGIIWFININDDTNRVCNDFTTSGITAFLFTIITCGIYGIYWNYKMGKQLYNAGRACGKDISDNSLIYLLLSCFGLGIVNYCIMQQDLNKFAE